MADSCLRSLLTNYRVSGWKVSKMKHLFLSNHLLHSFVIYTFAKTETQSFGTNRQSSIDFNMRLFSRWNASLMRSTFSSEVRGFPGDFTRNKLPVVQSLLSQNRMLFLVGGWRPYRVQKCRCTDVTDCTVTPPTTKLTELALALSPFYLSIHACARPWRRENWTKENFQRLSF